MLTRTLAVVTLTFAMLTAPLTSREIEPVGSFDLVGTAIQRVNGKAEAISFVGWLDYDIDAKTCSLVIDDFAFDGTLTQKGTSGEWVAELKPGFKQAYQDENAGDVVKVVRYRITKLVLQDGLVSGRLSARYRVTHEDGTKETVVIEGSFGGNEAF
ncbi:MAG: hypothetical protein IPH13_09440 [Planctomycetes bacterium]|nr:hypothetical protein [Planctomycetota bacterium]MCC7171235.1 hypothetical protein [Planctomycetota bacterium]